MMAALSFAASAFANDCKDPTADVCAKGQRPNDDDQPYEFCMVQHNDHEYCSGLSGGGDSSGGGESSTGVNYDQAYSSVVPSVGSRCTTSSGGIGIVLATGSRHQVDPVLGVRDRKCVPDDDGDGIENASDDCPNDPTNSDPSCMDDLTDCGYMYTWTVAMIESAIAVAGGVTALVVGSTIVIGGTSVSVAALGTTAGGLVLGGAAGYCLVAGLEG